MRQRIIIGGLVALLAGGAAHAASFDCSKARTPFAKAICSNPALSKADEKVAQSFAHAQIGLSPDARGELTSAQADWVKFANVACTKDAKPATKPYDADGIACLQSLFDDRIKQFGYGKSLGGLRFYSVDRFAAVIDPQPQENGATVGTKSVSTPRIDGTDPEAMQFNHYVATGTKDQIDPAIAEHPSADSGMTDDVDSLVATYADRSRITMVLTTYQYGHGAAHGNYAITYLHYLRTAFRPLEVGDVFLRSGWQAKLQSLALAALKKQLGDDLMLDDPKSIDSIVIDPTRWDFLHDGLLLQFEPYEVAAYAVGAPTVTIPWSDLDGLVTPLIVDVRP